MAKDLLTIRCPEDIQQAIEQRMEETGKSRTEVVVELLRSALNLEPPLPSTNTLNERFTSMLDKRYTMLYERLTEEIERQLSPIQNKLLEVEQGLGELGV